jgi:hypothetical protein
MGAVVPLHERAVSPKERAAFQQQRGKLCDEFARLSRSQRKRRAREYMAELVSISLSTRGFWGAWTLHLDH